MQRILLYDDSVLCRLYRSTLGGPGPRCRHEEYPNSSCRLLALDECYVRPSTVSSVMLGQGYTEMYGSPARVTGLSRAGLTVSQLSQYDVRLQRRSGRAPHIHPLNSSDVVRQIYF